MQPAPTAPLTDLPPAAAARFRAARRGLLDLDGVAESVRFMGTSWRWAWEYGVGSRKLCWLHVVRGTVSTTFTLSETELDRVRRLPRLAGEVARAVEEGQRTGPLKWCWLELSDRRLVDGFLRLARHKADWLQERSPPRRSTRPKAGGAGG